MKAPLLAGAVALMAVPAVADDAACPSRITVVGRAATAQAPDFAEIAVGIEAKGASASAALDAASKAAASVSTLAREANVPAADIGTAAVTLRPATRTVARPGGGMTEEPDGYVASNAVRLRLGDMTRLGDLLARMVQGGANRIDGITFGLRDPDGVTAKLQVEATRDARAKAAALAEAAGAKLGRLCTLSVLGAEPTPPYPMGMRALTAAAPKARPVPVEAGAIESAASVTAVYALEP
ncbi:SIMPL domain-containing protein [Methylobacterium aerolatum]|uniref:Uncharacterized protein YggE n=1 Tax=Methylobacterium aerolatum TaxID=418708 RepID=A0ABU0HVD7_9HYPH|nr:SIMPL domain-containing protein [Methylobacterium aerolatum]MDQ0446299.1 uncharacterized protein YggE [Methylobacterium aerolatum]GJD35642.1 26 kDa periplasmic immunogenic protein [Methylobacterium aerolatum]